MTSVTVTEAKDRLSSLIDAVEREHDHVRITRHGRTAAVLISEDDLESLQETIFWLSRAGLRDTLRENQDAIDRGETTSGDELRTALGMTAR